MRFFHEKLNSFDDLFNHQLMDVYDAELQIVDALPMMAGAATSGDLKAAFDTHLAETREHCTRLERVFQMLGKSPQRQTCPAMRGLMKEGNEAVGAIGDPMVKDAALIACAQRVEHYEMAAYGTLRTLARTVGRDEIAELLQATLDEEGKADKLLTSLAEGHINAQAAAAR